MPESEGGSIAGERRNACASKAKHLVEPQGEVIYLLQKLFRLVATRQQHHVPHPYCHMHGEGAEKERSHERQQHESGFKRDASAVGSKRGEGHRKETLETAEILSKRATAIAGHDNRDRNRDNAETPTSRIPEGIRWGPRTETKTVPSPDPRE